MRDLGTGDFALQIGGRLGRPVITLIGSLADLQRIVIDADTLINRIAGQEDKP